MKPRFIFNFLTALLVALSFSVVQQAQAALGGSTDSIASDKKIFKSTRSSVRTTSKYTVHEIHSAANNVREYVSPSGSVFGVAWNGMTNPDLTILLGTYAGEHKKAADKIKRQHGRSPVKIKSQNIILERWGHMRNLKGRAYIPALVPEGVNVDEIK